MPKKQQGRLLPWFGADTTVAEQYAAFLADRRHITVPFCGGLSVVAHLVETAGEVMCNDLHNHLINLCHVLRDPVTRARLIAELSETPFHEQVLIEAQAYCKRFPQNKFQTNVEAAVQYFITAWQGRSGKAGTESEFNGGLAMRWDAGGGSSPLRFQTAVRSLHEFWGPICERCSFLCRDWSEIVDKVKDSPHCGIYLDPPWVGAGEAYLHKFNHADHYSLCTALREFRHTKIVLRYGDDPLIRTLYAPGDRWGWHINEIRSRNQANGEVSELCITNFQP